MPNDRDVDWLLGRRFIADFTIIAIGCDPARTVTLHIHGDRYTISFDELMTVIGRGFAAEAAAPAFHSIRIGGSQ